MSEYHKKYYIENREHITSQQKEYRELTKEIIKKRKRDYYQKNRAFFLEKARQYRLKKFKCSSLKISQKDALCQSEQIEKFRDDTTKKIAKKF